MTGVVNGGAGTLACRLDTCVETCGIDHLCGAPLERGCEDEAMSISNALAELFHRDLTRLLQQLEAFPDNDVLWKRAPGIVNSAGNLVLHLEGNLREYVCRLLGGLPYRRAREEEFTAKGISIPLMVARIEEIRQLVPRIIEHLSDDQLQAAFPESPLGSPRSTQQFLIHLNGHVNYHLGQIDYLRRLLTRGSSVEYATL